MRKKVNETEVEAELHIQYKERQLKGAQDCIARHYDEEEYKLKEEIERLSADLATEQTVSKAIIDHLKHRKTEITVNKQKLDL